MTLRSATHTANMLDGGYRQGSPFAQIGPYIWGWRATAPVSNPIARESEYPIPF